MPLAALVSLSFGTCALNEVLWPGLGCLPVEQCRAEAIDFLKQNIFPFDVPNQATYFDGGIVVPTVDLALEARQRFGWAATVPKSLFQDAVLPYAVCNEARSNWRQVLWSKMLPILSATPNSSSLAEVFGVINAQLWTALGNFSGRPAIVFKSQQTPLIYDPMSTMLFGYASCTGISLLLVDALRTAGVPARLVGTPAWQGSVENGNHNWVEVYVGGDTDLGDGWAFIEGAPAGPGETLTNACDKWFCNPAHFGHNGTKVYATKFDRTGMDTSYPMAWELANHDVVGIDRSALYEEACNKCS